MDTFSFSSGNQKRERTSKTQKAPDVKGRSLCLLGLKMDNPNFLSSENRG